MLGLVKNAPSLAQAPNLASCTVSDILKIFALTQNTIINDDRLHDKDMEGKKGYFLKYDEYSIRPSDEHSSNY